MLLIRPSFEILTQIDRVAILKRIELAGRTCYKSEGRITEDSAPSFVKGIIESGHESVIEHASISVKFIVDRGVSHELVRHRIASYSQESTRFCDYIGSHMATTITGCSTYGIIFGGHVCFVIPSWVRTELPEKMEDDAFSPDWEPSVGKWLSAMRTAEIAYQDLRGMRWTPQQARSVLPNSLKTEIVTTMNLREWRHVLRLRTSKRAHPQMREVMIPLLEELKKVLPEVFQDVAVPL